MISLRTYLLGDADKDVLETSYRRTIDLFIQAISLHAVEGNKADYERFRADMKGFADRLATEQATAERFVVVGEALRALADYNRHTSHFLRTQNAELQNMITMLTQTVIAVGTNSETSVAGLQEIEKALEATRVVEDVRVVKAQLGECLNSVRGEAVRQKAEGKATLANIQRELTQSQERMGGMAVGPTLDPATGLPGKARSRERIAGCRCVARYQFSSAGCDQPPSGRERALWKRYRRRSPGRGRGKFPLRASRRGQTVPLAGASLVGRSQPDGSHRFGPRGGPALRREEAGEKLPVLARVRCYCRFPLVGQYFRSSLLWMRSCGRSISLLPRRKHMIMFEHSSDGEWELKTLPFANWKKPSAATHMSIGLFCARAMRVSCSSPRK